MYIYNNFCGFSTVFTGHNDTVSKYIAKLMH